MEAELREVLTPTPELLERAQRAQVQLELGIFSWKNGGKIDIFARDF
jgi:hypothetical protein